MSVVVEIPMALPSASNQRLHWAAKARQVKAQRKAVALSMFTARTIDTLDCAPLPERLPSLVVRLIRQSPRKLDDDNLRGAFKAVRDEVAAYFGVDDADPRIEWRYGQEKGPACVRIEFEVTS